MAHSNPRARRALRAVIGTVVLSTFFMIGERPAKAAEECISQAARDALTACPKGAPTISGRQKPLRVEVKSTPSEVARKSPTTPKPRDPTAGTSSPPRDDRKSRADARARPLLVAEIQGLESLFASTPRSAPDRPKLLRRLAEDYVELESAAFREKIEAEISSDEAKKRKDAKQASTFRAEAGKAEKVLSAARQAAIKYYTKLKDEHPKYCESTSSVDPAKSSGCIDEVLYYLAYEYEQANQLDQARKIYLELIQTRPQSKYIPNAYLAFGELFFNEAQGDPSKWAFAEQSYNEVVKYPPPENKVWGYARYKLGYVAWNRGDFPRAISEFKRAIEHGMQHPKLPNATELAISARRDIIPVYALSGDPKKAFDFFRPLSGESGGSSEKTFQMLDSLGRSYLDTGHYKEAIDLYEDLISRDQGPRSCGYQGLITDAVLASASGNKGAIVTALDKMLDAQRKFVQGNYPTDAKQKCSNITAAHLTETAMAWHIEAVGTGDVRGTGDRRTMRFASAIYDQVVRNFSQEQFSKFEFPRIMKEDWPNIFKIKYARADLYYANEDWANCGPAFDSVVSENPTAPLAPDAARAAVECYWKLYMEQHKDGSDRRRARALQCAPGDPTCASAGEKARFMPKPFTEAQMGMLTAFKRYFCYVKPPANEPSAKEAREKYADVAYARAYSYFEARHWEEAALVFRDVAFNFADLDVGIYATQLYLESLNTIRNHMDSRRQTCLATMDTDVPTLIELYCGGDKAKTNADQCADLHRVRRDIDWMKAEELIRQADAGGPNALALYEAGASAYMKIWRKYGEAPCKQKEPTCRRMEDVLYNASRAFQASRLIAKSIDAKKFLLDPNNNLDKTAPARKAVYEIGGNYQAIAMYDEAASYYERFAAENPRMEKAPEALQDAVVLRLDLGQAEQAIRDAELFDRSYGSQKPAQSARVSFGIGAHYAEKEDWESARRRLSGAMGLIDRSAAMDVQIQAHATLGRVLVKLNSPSGAAAEYKKVRSAWKDPQAAIKGLDALGGTEDEMLRRRARSLSAVGEALFFFAEQKRKEVDRIRFPEYKGSGTRDDVLRHINGRVKDWIEKKRPAIEAAQQEYFNVVTLEPAPPPRWVIAAGARVGQMWGKFVAEFRAAPIPKEWKGEGTVPGTDLTYAELHSNYYVEIDRASEPHKLKAKAAYEECLKYSVKYMYFDEYSRSCEVWLSTHYASQYHLIDELRGAPTQRGSGLMHRSAPLNLDGTPFLTAAPQQKAAPPKTAPQKEATPGSTKTDDDGGRGRSEAR